MKRQTSFSIFRVCVISIGLVVQASAGYASAEMPSKQAADENKTEQQLYKNALRVIKKAEKRARISGTPYRISCQYKIKDNRPVSASTEVHYADYRKKSDSQSIEYAPVDGKLDRVVEFVYKPNSKVLAVVERDPAKLSKRLATRTEKIDI